MSYGDLPLYRCDECGGIFNKPYEWTESYGQSFEGSPCCHANYEEVEYCECGNIKELYHKYCRQCEELMESDDERLRDTA